MLKEQLEKAGFDTARNSLEAAWLKAASTHSDIDRRQMAFWHSVLHSRELQSAAADMLDKIFLSENGRSLAVDHTSTERRRGQDTDDSHIARASAAPSPAARIAALQVVTSIYSTYKLEDGTPIGDVKMGSIPRLKAKYRRHAALLDMIGKYAVATDPFVSVRDAVPLSELQKMLQSAAERQDNEH